MSDWENYVRQMVDRAQNASREIAVAAGEVKNDWLRRAAKSIRTETNALMDANRKDIDQSPQYGLEDAAVDR
ncbi:MAG: gamma-glutamyl-phosphate reductase, partial [Planctomycetes bacterium]|nr:gamma-glutamyl-phosphate reductase [Planctomycetota bacterium]